MEEYQIIRFKTGSLQLDVRISPNEDTVWLTQIQIANLFNVTKNNISNHINNILREQELDISDTKESWVPGPDNKVYKTKLYNLDMIISVGYRVKSKNGIIFRQWANKVLKAFLLKGYAVDENRALITYENYLTLKAEVDMLKKKIVDLEKTINVFKPNEKVLVENQTYTAFIYINKIFRQSEKQIIIIDGYLDDSSLEFFSNVNRNINIILITHKTNRFSENTLNLFKKEFINTTIIENKTFHDRFFIVDDTVYSIGTSLNNLGKKLTTIKVMENTNANDLIENLLGRK